MTDQLFDLTQQGGVGRQPITNVGRVAYNLRLDQNEFETRKRRGAAGSLWPSASLEDKNFWILPRDICLTKKQRVKRKETDGMMTVFSVLNGIRSDGMSHRQLIESMTFGAIAGGQGAKFDTTGNEPRHPEFVGIVGGLYTIVNNGPERITNGQQVFWDLPEAGIDVGRAAELNRRGPQRITAFTRPYMPSKHTVTARNIKAAINKSHGASLVQTSVTDQAAMRFKNVALHMVVNSMEALLSSGLVSFNREALNDSAVREQNAAAWRKEKRDNGASALTTVAKGIGCRKMGGGAEAAYMMPGTGMSVKKYICDLLTYDDGARLARLADGGNIPSGDSGEMLRNQEACIKDLLVGVEQANRFVTDRIFCKALTPAAPGKEFVGVFAHYRQ